MNDPAYGDVKTTCQRYGFGRSTCYDLLKHRSIRAKKLGSRTLVEFASVNEYLATLPAFGEVA